MGPTAQVSWHVADFMQACSEDDGVLSLQFTRDVVRKRVQGLIPSRRKLPEFANYGQQEWVDWVEEEIERQMTPGVSWITSG